MLGKNITDIFLLFAGSGGGGRG